MITRKVVIDVLLGLLLVAVLSVHILFLIHERHYFGVGGEWFVYVIAIGAYLWRLSDVEV